MDNGLQIAFFSAQEYEETLFESLAVHHGLSFHFFTTHLNEETVGLAQGKDAVCVFVNDDLSAPVLEKLKGLGIKHVALRCAGYNNVDVEYARELGISVSRVPAYSPDSVAEHAIALIMTLNRKLHKAYNRVRENNFNLQGLMGFSLKGKTVGIIGTGHIGACVHNILAGFGCRILCYDPYPNEKLIENGAIYVDLSTLITESKVISLHCPLNDDTYHIINDQSIAKMQDGVMLINTSRGGLIDTHAVIQGLKTGKIGQLGLDVYEMESELFFKDHSLSIVQDDLFERLISFPNVLITGHQGFFTQEALYEITNTTIDNIRSLHTENAKTTNFVC